MINLIDSPGHIDFSSEVSTASRLCDGALVVVDVVEGVCSQTVTVLRQSWVEKLKPVLVLNKIDRLITDLQMTPMEAYTHLSKIIEQVNAVVGSFFAGQRMEDDLKWRERAEAADGDKNEEYVEASDEDLYFAPEKNNVVFGSAIDGWGFNISQFAAIYQKKLGIKREKLEKVLWGDFYFDPKTKKVVPGGSSALKGRNHRPLFVQLVLENIWAIYDCVIVHRNPDKIRKIVDALEVKVIPREITSGEPKTLAATIFNQWIPISRSILLSVIDGIPSPLVAQKQRMPFVIDSTPAHEDIPAPVVGAITACDSNGPASAFISKVVAVPTKDIPAEGVTIDKLTELRNRSRKARELAMSQDTDSGLADATASLGLDDAQDQQDDCDECIIGFARVYSGTLKVGQEFDLLGPRYSPKHPSQYAQKVTVTGLFLLMGRELVPIKEAPAGGIVGIGGLDGYILKSGTLVSPGQHGPNFAATNTTAPPILRVAVEPVDPTKFAQLERGLQLLNMSDPSVQVSVLENGEHILATAGELHLERCIKDLKERFARVDIQYSKPVVSFRETLVEDKDWKVPEDHPTGTRGYREIKLGCVTVGVQVYPLPAKVTECLVENASCIRSIVEKKANRQPSPGGNGGADEVEDDTENVREMSDAQVQHFKDELDKAFKSDKRQAARWPSQPTSAIVACGPRRVGPCLLMDRTSTIGARLFPSEEASARSQYEDNLFTGFQLATNRGGLAAEQLQGVAVIIKSIENDESAEEAGSAATHRQIISEMREAIHDGVADFSPRLMLATYKCDIQATTEVLGKVYGVITKRRGRILSEEMKEGTSFFNVHASLPVVESFGFSEEIRKRTSGAANPQLVFSGYEMLDQDPFWVPTTEEELEELGETADRENIALGYLTAIRKRKGLPVHEKVVDAAERQRNLKK